MSPEAVVVAAAAIAAATAAPVAEISSCLSDWNCSVSISCMSLRIHCQQVSSWSLGPSRGARNGMAAVAGVGAGCIGTSIAGQGQSCCC
ncbi:hypothetical protein B0O80DRAFT_445560 [Mortierella sp. GBAus27b]|nr:hypothetical protein B0O80DRAFT_445560 [Mortierella sp. GBAus27b]